MASGHKFKDMDDEAHYNNEVLQSHDEDCGNYSEMTEPRTRSAVIRAASALLPALYNELDSETGSATADR